MVRKAIIIGVVALATSGVAAWALSGGTSGPTSGAVVDGGLAASGGVTAAAGSAALPSIPAAPAAPSAAAGLDCDAPDRVVARVGRQPIAARELCAALRRAAGPGVERDPRLMAQRGPDVLARLVEGEVVAQALAAKGAPVTTAEVDAALQKVAEGRAGFEAQLRSEGLTLGDLRAELRDRLARQKVTALLGQVEIDDQAIAAEYARGPNRWGLVARANLDGYVVRVASESANAEAHAHILQVAAALSAGRTPQAERLPAFELEANGLDPDLEQLVFAGTLPLNTWSAPVRTKVGWAVVKVLERGEGRAPPLSEVRDLVAQAAKARRLVDEQARVVADLRAGADVSVFVVW